MNVGIIGLGKLGLPVAVAMGLKMNVVVGYDKNETIIDYCVDPFSYPYKEEGIDGKTFDELLKDHAPIICESMEIVCNSADLIFVAIQTPHDEKYDGAHPIPEDRKDFDYSYLVAAVTELMLYIQPDQTVVIISTCIPGAIRREILPLTAGKCNLIYNPFFIAMGTVVRDFLCPEFLLIGLEDETDIERLRPLYDFYQATLMNAPDRMDREYYHVMSLESAELTKVAYNTFIGFKIGLANTFGLLCDTIPNANCDDVMDALKSASDRLISKSYLSPGMGDGGGCHPRDLIAMSYLQSGFYSHFNPFDDVMHWRESHAEVLASRLLTECEMGQTLAIYGTAFKAGTSMEDGSHSLLVANILEETGLDVELYDPHVQRICVLYGARPRCILIGCRHEYFRTMIFDRGTTVIDPFRYIPDQDGVKVIRIGKASNVRRHLVPTNEPSPFARHHLMVGNNSDGSTKN
jgi:UDPglucose 6-dehydrogenase